MTNDNQHSLIQIIGPKLGEISVALLSVVQALKEQPGFDHAAFDASIRRQIAGEEAELLTRTILSHTLDDYQSPGEIPPHNA